MTHNLPEAHIAFEGKKISDDLTHANYAGAHAELVKEMHNNPHSLNKLLSATNADLQHHHQHHLSVSYDSKRNVSHIDFNKHQIYGHSQLTAPGHHEHSGKAAAPKEKHPTKTADHAQQFLPDMALTQAPHQVSSRETAGPAQKSSGDVAVKQPVEDNKTARGKTNRDNLPDLPSNGQADGVARGGSIWKSQHDANVQKAHSSDADTVYFGDSITAGLPVIKGKFGINSDNTDNLRYRLNHGEADLAKQPANAVLHIGVNDLGIKTPDAIANDILADAKLLHDKLPDSKLLVVGLMSRPGFDKQISEINAIVKDKIANAGDPKLQFTDLRGQMHGLYRDGIHPTYPDPKHPSRPSGYVQMLSSIKKALHGQGEN